MKRALFAFIAFFTLVAGFAQLQNVLPISVQRFLDEREDRERLLRNNKTAEAAAYQSMYAPSTIINGVEMVDAFIDIDNVSAIPILRSHGVIVNCEFDGFVTAHVPVKLLKTLTKLPGVKNVEISRLLKLCTDSTLSATHALQVLNGPDYGLPQAYDGSGVIIGIIDEGFDYQHIAFRRADDPSRTRIVRVYDEVDTTGHPIMLGNNQGDGSVFMGEQIDTMTYDTNNAHGTHTASIAAGTHIGGYGGMAPGADIVLCSVRNMGLYIAESNVINAIKYVYSYADSVGKPCVLSLSISTNQGPHDGLDRLSQVVGQLTGPGRLFVISAGNTGDKNYYVHGPVTVDKPLNMLLSFNHTFLNTDGAYYYINQWFDTWVRAPRVKPLCKFHIFDKETKRIVWESDLISMYKKIYSTSFSDYYEPDTSYDSVGYVSALITQTSSFKYEMQGYVYNLKSKSYTVSSSGWIKSRYQIGVSLYAPKLLNPNHPDSCYIDSWMCLGNRAYYDGPVYVDEISEDGDTISTQTINNFYHYPNSYSSINTYAVHDSIISAGAYVAKTSYHSLYLDSIMGDPNGYKGGIYSVSSYELPGYGPTGRHLPTITAPGFRVVAAGSRYSYFNTGHRDVVMRTEDGYPWGVMSGTSMAAPTVAGIIAQWLQIEPNLNPSDIKNIFAETAIRDINTQDFFHGQQFGPYGKIDAYAGAQYLLSLKEDEILLGDVNGDGNITIRDVTVLINYLLSDDESLGVVFLNADINGDGRLAIRDLTMLINMILQPVSTNQSL